MSTLSERIAANRCAVENCLRERLPDALVCRVHLGDLWANRLPEWRKRSLAKDFTGTVAL